MWLAKSERHSKRRCLPFPDTGTLGAVPPQQPNSPRRPPAPSCCPGAGRGWECWGQKAAAGSSEAPAPGGCAHQCGWAGAPQGPRHHWLWSPCLWTSAWRKSWQVFTDRKHGGLKRVLAGQPDFAEPLEHPPFTLYLLCPPSSPEGLGSGSNSACTLCLSTLCSLALLPAFSLGPSDYQTGQNLRPLRTCCAPIVAARSGDTPLPLNTSPNTSLSINAA